MKIDRMDLADFGTPDQIVRGILQLLPDLSIPVPIKELASQLDIAEFAELETESFEGGLLTDENKSRGIILINERSSLRRQRFTVGHELGHFLCPWHKPSGPSGFLCLSEDMRRLSARNEERTARMEVEANRFAAQILMPEPHFRKDIRARSGSDIEHIIAFAARYDTSKEATTRRYVELQDEPCAAIMSCNGRVLRIYRSKAFPFIEVSHGQPLPSGSLSARTGMAEGVVSDWEDTDAALWLASSQGSKIPTMYEQVLLQQGGYRLTLLSLDDECVDEVNEEDEILESWTARFRR